MRRNDEPVDSFDEGDDDEDVIVLELEDAPRRAKLFETLLRFGHPVWMDAAPIDNMPQRNRPTFAEELEAIYPNGLTAPAVKMPWRYGR
jgi:hypothetical protein